jgi:RNA polymerase sigma factor (sigma-70 family)
MSKNNKIMKNFLSIEENQKLFESYKREPTEEKKKLLNKKYKKFAKTIRAISYLNKTIHFESKKMDQRIRIHNQRFQLILDKPTTKEDNTNLVDLVVDESIEKQFDEITSEQLEDYINNPNVANSIKKLTEKQKNILYLLYVKNLKANEIAKITKVSQQSVSKTKNKAIEKIRSGLIA